MMNWLHMTQLTLSLAVTAAHADVFSMPPGLASLEVVSVGDSGNVPDVTGYGSVGYEYQIGKFEITAGQYTEFLNAVASDDPHGLYHEYMWLSDEGCKIRRSGQAGQYAYSVAADRANRPVSRVSWDDAARFVNWLHNGQPTGIQDVTTTEDGSYFLDGAVSDAELLGITREPDATWVIPTTDEWYKAAYYQDGADGGSYFDYPTGSNLTPSNTLGDQNSATYFDGDFTIGAPYYRTEVGAHESSPSPHGTFDQGGNVWEWNEDLNGTRRILRGASFALYAEYMNRTHHADGRPSWSNYFNGFRVANVPEPSTMVLLAFFATRLILRRSPIR